VPGGTTGWHTHPGHSLIIVTEGEVTTYEGHDPDCKPRVYKKGEVFLDPGGEHVQMRVSAAVIYDGSCAP
jgi:quercetin dioxygenase-like cupin family protein